VSLTDKLRVEVALRSPDPASGIPAGTPNPGSCQTDSINHSFPLAAPVDDARIERILRPMPPSEREGKPEPIGSNSPWVTSGSSQVYGTAFSHGPERHGNEPPSREPRPGLVDRIRRLLRRK
jgi:hypothetical protein